MWILGIVAGMVTEGEASKRKIPTMYSILVLSVEYSTRSVYILLRLLEDVGVVKK